MVPAIQIWYRKRKNIFEPIRRIHLTPGRDESSAGLLIKTDDVKSDKVNQKLPKMIHIEETKLKDNKNESNLKDGIDTDILEEESDKEIKQIRIELELEKIKQYIGELEKLLSTE